MGPRCEFQQGGPSGKLMKGILTSDDTSCWISQDQQFKLPPCMIANNSILTSVFRDQFNSGNYKTTVQNTYLPASLHLNSCTEYLNVWVKVYWLANQTGSVKNNIFLSEYRKFNSYINEEHFTDIESHIWKEILENKSKITQNLLA